MRLPAVDFLRHLFPLDLDGYLVAETLIPGRKVTIEHSFWFTIEELHSEPPPVLDINETSEPFRGFFFCPHPFQSPTSRSKENAALLTQVLYMDCDDEFVNPWTFDPKPSIIVNTSPGRHHVYWLLSEPIECTEAERLNKALAYYYLTKDKSGWDLSQLLRIPETSNFKRKRHLIEVLDEHSTYERYPTDAFNDIPPAPQGTAGEQLPTPDPARLPSYDDLKDRYSELWSKRFDQSITKRAQDRSSDLWYLMNSCFRMDCTREETFIICLKSVNNKWADCRYRAEDELWKDIGRCELQLMGDVDEPILQKLNDLVKSKQPTKQKYELMAAMILKDMQQKGRFFYEPNTLTSFFHMNKEMYELARGRSRITHLLQDLYNLNSVTKEYAFVLAHIQNSAPSVGEHIELRHMSHYDMAEGVLYVSDHDDCFWRMNGADAREHLENGIDRIFFRTFLGQERPFAPKVYNYTAADPGFSLLDELVFGKCNFDTTFLPLEDARFLVRAWTVALFFPDIMLTRPILLVEGTKGSGKTTLFKTIAWLLEGPKGQVAQMPADEDDFKEICREKNYIFLDGVDQSTKWLPNALSTIATGTRQRKRLLYTNNDFATYTLACMFGITTMDAKFMRDDVADRSIILTARALRSHRAEHEMKAEILEHRDFLWQELLDDLEAVTKELQKPADHDADFRMADFAKVLFALCKVHNRDPKYLVNFMKRRQTQAVLEHDTFWQCLQVWLGVVRPSGETNAGRRVKAGILHRELAGIANELSLPYTKIINGAQGLGRKLHQDEHSFEAYGIEMRTKDINNSATYTFHKTEETD